MAYTEVKTTGYGSRVGSSFKGIASGFILLGIGTALLWWNEGRAVHRAQDIKEVGKAATHVEDIMSIAPEGQLIHANGTAETTEVLTDGTFGVSVNALSLDRTVEYYQWVEHSKTETKEKIGGTKEEVTTYTYERAWVGEPVNSSDFHDPDYRGVNSTLAGISFEDREVYAENVAFGAYKIPASFISSVASCAGRVSTALAIDPAVLAELNNQIARTQPVVAQTAQAAANAVQDSTYYEYVHVSGNQIYFGKNANGPAVGDVRVKFTNTRPSAVISLVAVVQGDSFTEYKTKNGSNDRYITSGTKSLDDMMQSAQESNEMMTWILRIIGCLLVIGGLKGMFGFISSLFLFLPFLAHILSSGVGLICTVVGIVWSLIIIAIAWIFYRPILGITLLVIAAALIGYLVWKGKNAPKQPEGPAVPQA